VRTPRCRSAALGKPALGRDEVDEPLHPASERLARGVLGGERDCRLRAAVHFATKYGDDQVRALREVAVHRAEPNAGLLGDLPDSRIDSIACEHRHRGMEEGFGVALRVSALLRGLRHES
jgi:hypothetical protein